MGRGDIRAGESGAEKTAGRGAPRFPLDFSDAFQGLLRQVERAERGQAFTLDQLRALHDAARYATIETLPQLGASYLADPAALKALAPQAHAFIEALNKTRSLTMASNLLLGRKAVAGVGDAGTRLTVELAPGIASEAVARVVGRSGVRMATGEGRRTLGLSEEARARRRAIAEESGKLNKANKENANEGAGTRPEMGGRTDTATPESGGEARASGREGVDPRRGGAGNSGALGELGEGGDAAGSHRAWVAGDVIDYALLDKLKAAQADRLG